MRSHAELAKSVERRGRVVGKFVREGRLFRLLGESVKLCFLLGARTKRLVDLKLLE
jgi:hypothetical protein